MSKIELFEDDNQVAAGVAAGQSHLSAGQGD
jgi:hypothetical protein